MKKIIITFLAIVGLLANIQAQEESSFVDRIYVEYPYLFDSFKDGRVYFKDGTRISALMNYNVVFDKVAFVDEGTIKNVGNIDQIDRIIINKHSFSYYDGKYLEKLAVGPELTLLVHREVDIDDIENDVKGPYGTSLTTSAYNKINDISSTAGIHISYDKIDKTKPSFAIDKIFYIHNGKKLIFISSMRLKKIFGKKYVKQIREYILKNKIGLSNQEDLLDLFEYYHSLK